MLGREIEASYLVVYARRSWKAVGNACPVRWDRKRGGNSRGGKSHGWWSSADSAGPNESQDRAWERKKRGNLINWINWNILLDLFLSIGMDVWRVNGPICRSVEHRRSLKERSNEDVEGMRKKIVEKIDVSMKKWNFPLSTPLCFEGNFKIWGRVNAEGGREQKVFLDTFFEIN